MERFTSKMIGGITPAYTRRLAQSLAREEATGRRSRMVRAHRIPMPPKPDEVRGLRKSLRFGRAELAEVLGVSSESVRSWEQGRRTPDSPVTKLLRLLERAPELAAVLAAV